MITTKHNRQYNHCPIRLTLTSNRKAIHFSKNVKWIMFAIVLLGVGNAWGVGTDSLSTGVTTAETILTGSMMRLIVIAGSVFGVIKAYMASSPLLMGGSVAIGIGINLLMTWVKATWPMLI